MSNVFSASFDELLAQAGVPTSAVSQTTETQTAEQTVVETPAQPTAQPTAQHDVQPPTQVPSFDDLLTQAGITTQPADATAEETEATDVTEAYRVDTDVFGDNDAPATAATAPTAPTTATTATAATAATNQTTAPNATTSFDDLLAQAGAVETKAEEEAKAKAEDKAEAKAKNKEEKES